MGAPARAFLPCDLDLVSCRSRLRVWLEGGSGAFPATAGGTPMGRGRLPAPPPRASDPMCPVEGSIEGSVLVTL